ncbi:MAG TPA: helix-turn-helix domain-containing protein [Phycisphaerales bacterium]
MSESFLVSDPVDTPATAPILDVIARAKARLGPPSMPGGAIRLTFTPRTVTLDMIRDSFKGLEDRFPPMLSLEQAADLLGLKEQTIRKHLSEGKYPRSSRRGHPVRFWRDLLVHEYMSGGLK